MATISYTGSTVGYTVGDGAALANVEASPPNGWATAVSFYHDSTNATFRYGLYVGDVRQWRSDEQTNTLRTRTMR
jgi:hypothetical protein